jgi:hypothetical protein
MKMLLLSPMLVTQSLTETADLLTLMNKRLKCDAICLQIRALNRLLSKKASLPSFHPRAGLKNTLEEA